MSFHTRFTKGAEAPLLIQPDGTGGTRAVVADATTRQFTPRSAHLLGCSGGKRVCGHQRHDATILKTILCYGTGWGSTRKLGLEHTVLAFLVTPLVTTDLPHTPQVLDALPPRTGAAVPQRVAQPTTAATAALTTQPHTAAVLRVTPPPLPLPLALERPQAQCAQTQCPQTQRAQAQCP